MRRLQPYVHGLEKIDLADNNMVAEADALRQALEIVFGQRITFRGELRQPSGPFDVSDNDVEVVARRVTLLSERSVEANVTVQQVGGTVIGVDWDDIGLSGTVTGVDLSAGGYGDGPSGA